MTTRIISAIFRPAMTIEKSSKPFIHHRKSKKRFATTVNRLGIVVTLMAFVAVAFYTSSSASSSSRVSRGNHPNSGAAANPSSAPKSDAKLNKANAVKGERGSVNPLLAINPLSMLMPQAAPSETIATYDATCTNPKDSFDLGETVCVKVTGAPLGSAGHPASRIAWVSHYGSIVQGSDITTDPQSGFYTIPTTATQTFNTPCDANPRGFDENGNPNPPCVDATVTVDNRGTWSVHTISASDASLRTTAYFTVHDPQTPYVDLSIHQAVAVAQSQVSTGSGSVFELFVTNNGPDAAQNVVLTDTVPSNATFSSFIENTSQGFDCNAPDMSGVITCTVASLPKDATAHFTFSYTADGAAGSVITNTASVTSATAELQPGDNSSSIDATVPTSSGAQTCTLTCHENISVAANTTQNGNPGAIVNFGAAGLAGNCGAITSSPASGSFFPVGTTVVSVTSDTGGGSCSFTVTVVQGNPPTINCPANVTTTVPQNATSANVDPGTPTTNPSTGVTVVGVRSDNAELTDPYPVGVTTIAWTATDSNGLKSTCTQRITVNESTCGDDTTPPTITAPPNITIGTGPDAPSCTVALDDELGQATATDDCTVSVTASGIPAGNAFPVGTTTITYTATDGAGHTATATQTVTVFDNTPPVIVAPADASYVCPSEVPAANPAQAHGANENLPNGGPVTDNCGTPNVTVNETRTGAGSASSPLIITRTYTATDGANNSASATQTITVIDNTPPTISAPANATYQCASEVPAASPAQATASDNCAAPTVAVNESNNGGVGSVASPLVITRTYTATDAAGNSAAATQTITVIDTIPPTVTLNGANPMTVECHTGFTDPGATASDNCAVNLTSAIVKTGSVNPNVPGTYTLTYTVNDGHGNTTTKTRTVNVVDTTPPVITLNGQNISLWPPNHQYQTVRVADLVASATDGCDTNLGLGSVFISKVTSDEVENGNGDGNTFNDIVIGADCKSVQLRSERDGNGNGRVYTITFKVRDASGNVGTKTAQVKVPKSQGNGTVVDDGVHYTVNSNCP